MLELSVEPDATLCLDLFPSNKTMGHHGRISDSAISICLKVFQKKDICWAPLIYKGLLDNVVSYPHANNYWVILHRVNRLEALGCEGYR